jgi:RHS repeat-associated protein
MADDAKGASGSDTQVPEIPFAVSAPQISLPKGGGAIRGIGEKFSANPVTGTGSLSVPIALSPGRSGFGPQLALSYDSGAGISAFGLGWTLSLPAITRRTDKGLPQYDDAGESDVFILSGAEDLVPELVQQSDGTWQPEPIERNGYVVWSYRPRIEGLFSRIERWTRASDGDSYWRSISRDNVTTLYGKTLESRVADPANLGYVFTWLISESRDDKGNAITYEYVPEDSSNIDLAQAHERNRTATSRAANRYLKRIKYGNTLPTLAQPDLSQQSWLFEAVFDYGEGHVTPLPADSEGRQFVAASLAATQPWPTRQDPFSRYRAGFDIRTYRLCRQVLMFHHFTDELGTPDCLVRSTEFAYTEGTTASFITSATQSGYVRQSDGSYLKRSLPRLDFEYSAAVVQSDVQEVDPASLANLPANVDGGQYQWLDLDGEGAQGILAAYDDVWYYKRNLSPLTQTFVGDQPTISAAFETLTEVARLPGYARAGTGRHQFLDLAGDGQQDCVVLERPNPGFYKRTADQDWENFLPLTSVPNVDWNDPNLRFVDLNGDGHADVLVTEHDVFTWYPSLAEAGFNAALRVAKARDEETGPAVIFADGTQSLFLADMTGDGLTDIVRVRNGAVCYWPNIGYGQFGPKITMDNAPWFEAQDLFDPRRVRLADIDGSGTADIVYLASDAVRLYFNQVGNGWSGPQALAAFPRVDNLASVQAMDLLGNGTACLVWMSSLPNDTRRNMRYVDLMGGQKPHLLISTNNNMGAVTKVQYATSTKFYLRDRLAGRPWATKLAFPVHVIERLEIQDLISNTTLVSTYRYRHGYYDGIEREFRGFAYVEQRDAESLVGDSDLPPIVTKTWFHNGAWLEESALDAFFKNPANQEFFAGDPQAAFLPDTDLPTGLTDTELREAARALKSSILRQEIYSDDGTPKAALPYSVSERSYRLTTVQPQGPNRHAVFFSHPCETIDYHYERNPADPRISHALTLEIDAYGNVLRSAAIGYQRRTPAFDEQGKTLATLTESQVTNAIVADDAYRTPLPAEVKTFELTAPTLAGATALDFSTIDAIARAATAIAYELPPDAQQAIKRLLSQVRTLYRKDDLTAFLPLAQIEPLALPGESYKRALTAGLLAVYQAKASAADLTATLSGPQGQYRDIEGDGPFWISSGQTFFSSGPTDSPAQEFAFAQAHFFLPHRYRDPFGADSIVAYDDKYNLSVVSTTDAVGNTTTAVLDYRVLQPVLVTDPNGNRAQALFDAMGMLAGTAVQGKVAGPVEGDSFDSFVTDLSPAQIGAFFDATDPRALAISYLGTATTRIVYDLDRAPVCAATIARETHVSALASGQQTQVQMHFVYSDGFGREAQTKVPAEPGPLDLSDPNSPVQDPRWIGTGAKVYNNKGKPVRQYEPFFSATPQFSIEKWGVSTTLFYDSAERVVATLHPNNTFEKVVFDPWMQKVFDVNDTVIFDPKSDPDVGDFFGKLPDADYLPTWYQQRVAGALGPYELAAAQKAAAHANTPAIAHFDGLGRTFLTIVDNGKDASGAEQLYSTRTVLDIEGNQSEVIDAIGRVVMRYDYGMLKVKIHQASMEAGERWTLNDATGKPILGWNSRNYVFRTEYDVLHRPLKSYVRGGDPSEANPSVFAQEILVGQTIYGDNADAGLTAQQQVQANLRGKVFRHCDSAGIVVSDLYDFKGNMPRSSRQFASDYRNPPDWSQNPALEGETFSNATTYDALNRAIAATAPDGSVYRPTFSEAGLLEQVDVNLRGAQVNGQPVWTPFVTGITYNAKGQRTLIQCGNGAATAYAYDPKTFRLTNLKTTRAVGLNGLASQIFNDPATLQNLGYVYDPSGNITRIADAALTTVFNANQQVDPACDYTYDPLYRVIQATGREHIGQSAFAFAPPDGNYRDYPFVGAAQQSDLQALRNYTERYAYDAVGNFLTMAHQAVNGNWTRAFAYNETSLIEPGKQSNRLSQTALQTGTSPPVEPYAFDAHGNMTRMPHLPMMRWNFKDEMCASSRQVVNAGTAVTTYYVYGADGQRTRKVSEGQNGARQNERLYLGEFEVYREYGSGAAPSLERQTLHVMDDKQRVALLDTQTIGAGASTIPARRYQLGNHLGSASLELDEIGGLISYEEYGPHGASTFQTGRGAAELSLKRFRFTGKERDQETGFSYHGARYYAPWLGKWINCDPMGLFDGSNLYAYVSGNPVSKIDPTGNAGTGSAPHTHLFGGGLTLQLPLMNSDGLSGAEKARLMSAGYETVKRIKQELHDYFGIETQMGHDTTTYFSGCSTIEGYSKVTLTVSDDENSRQAALNKFRDRLMAVETAAGGSPDEIKKRVDTKIGEFAKGRDFLVKNLKEGIILNAQVHEDSTKNLTQGPVLLGMQTTQAYGYINVNPYFFFREGNGGWVEGIDASSPQARAANGPAIDLLHELMHYNAVTPSGEIINQTGNMSEGDEQAPIRAVDQVTQALPGLVDQREWYGHDYGVIDEHGFSSEVQQNRPGDTYFLGLQGRHYSPSTDLAGKEWIKYPNIEQLTTGRRP